LILVVLFVSPISVSAATKAGIKPGSFFYFLDTTFENISLFFTFNPEKKATKALGYANERLAEIQAIAEEKNPDAVKTAIANYESNVALATEKSKEVEDKGKTENLLTLIADTTSKNQEVLSAVLIKVPDEAKETITQAIEASRKGQEEAMTKIAELKGEVGQLKKEFENLKKKSDDTQTAEIERLRKEVEELKLREDTQTKSVQEQSKQKSGTVPAVTKPATPPVSESISAQSPATNQTPQISSNELEDGLNRLYTQLTLNFIKTSSDHLVNIAALLASKFDILVDGRDYCAQTYGDRIKEKDECMLSYPLPDPMLGEKITQEVVKLDSLYKRVSAGTNFIIEAANMLREYNSIETRIYSFKDYIPSPLQPVSISSIPKPVPPVGSFSCTISPITNSYSCSDSLSNMRTSCQISSITNSWNCRNSDGSNISCQMSPVANSVTCRSY